MITIGDVASMEWGYFECFVAALYLKQGFKTVYRTPMHDDGVDVVAISGIKGVLIQCKTFLDRRAQDELGGGEGRCRRRGRL